MVPLVTTNPFMVEKFARSVEGTKAIYRELTPNPRRAPIEYLVRKGGVAEVVAEVYKTTPQYTQSVWIAANSLRPCGGLVNRHPNGYTINEKNIDADTGGQEERVLRKVFVSSHFSVARMQEFVDTLSKVYGAKDLSQTAEDGLSTQGVDFKEARPKDYNQVYLVLRPAVRIAHREDSEQRKVTDCPIHLMMVDAPCAAFDEKEPTSLTSRYANPEAVEDVAFLMNCVREKLRAAFDAAAAKRYDVVHVAKISTGINAGPHRKVMEIAFPKIVQEICDEYVGPRGESRAHYFKRIIIPDVLVEDRVATKPVTETATLQVAAAAASTPAPTAPMDVDVDPRQI